HASRSVVWCCTTSRVIRRISCARKPRLVTRATGSSQNLATDRSRCTWMCGGSPRSELKKMKLYGPSRSTVGIEPHFWHPRFPHSEERFYAEKSKVATEAERRGSPAAESGSGADAGGSQVQPETV